MKTTSTTNSRFLRFQGFGGHPPGLQYAKNSIACAVVITNLDCPRNSCHHRHDWEQQQHHPAIASVGSDYLEQRHLSMANNSEVQEKLSHNRLA